jgi:hypothetical protein
LLLEMATKMHVALFQHMPTKQSLLVLRILLMQERVSAIMEIAWIFLRQAWTSNRLTIVMTLRP